MNERAKIYSYEKVVPEEVLKKLRIKKQLEQAGMSAEDIEWALKNLEAKIITEDEALTPSNVIKFRQRRPVAIHEGLGHGAVARKLGWTVILESVSPSGNTLGVTITYPDVSKPPERLFYEAMMISAGGEMAEDAAGIHDHSGCGYDRAKQQRYAEIYARYWGNGQSPDQILTQARSEARSLVDGPSTSNLQYATSLVRVS